VRERILRSRKSEPKTPSRASVSCLNPGCGFLKVIP